MSAVPVGWLMGRRVSKSHLLCSKEQLPRCGKKLYAECCVVKWHEHDPRGYWAHDEGYYGVSPIHNEDHGYSSTGWKHLHCWLQSLSLRRSVCSVVLMVDARRILLHGVFFHLQLISWLHVEFQRVLGVPYSGRFYRKQIRSFFSYMLPEGHQLLLFFSDAVHIEHAFTDVLIFAVAPGPLEGAEGRWRDLMTVRLGSS